MNTAVVLMDPLGATQPLVITEHTITSEWSDLLLKCLLFTYTAALNFHKTSWIFIVLLLCTYLGDKCHDV